MLDMNSRNEFTMKLLERYLVGLRYKLELSTSFEEVYEEIAALLDEIGTTIRYPPQLMRYDDSIVVVHVIGRRCLREIYNKAFYLKRVQRIKSQYDQLREKVVCLKMLACAANNLQELCDPTDHMRGWADRVDIVEDLVDIVYKDMPYYYDLIKLPMEWL